jgi:ABC-type dipeptide/oligopeptide/nickel transport system ATPase component
MSVSDTILEVRDLRVRFARPSGGGVVDAVNGAGFSVGAGRCVALVGRSGSGKTATALSIMGLLPRRTGRVSEGRVLFGARQGREPVDLLALNERSMRRVRGGRIAMVFQEPGASLNPVLTIGEQIGESLRLHQRLRGRANRQRAAALLWDVGIGDAERSLGAYPHQLSGGMQQRAMIAMALAGEPALLIADEPTSSLDVTVQAQILELLNRVRRSREMAMLLITHDMGVVAELADDVCVIEAGSIVEHGPAQSVFSQPSHEVTRRLLHAAPRIGACSLSGGALADEVTRE